MFKQILGPSPALYVARKVGSFIRGGGDNVPQDVKPYYTDEEFFEDVIEKSASILFLSYGVFLCTK